MPEDDAVDVTDGQELSKAAKKRAKQKAKKLAETEAAAPAAGAGSPAPARGGQPRRR